MSTPTTYDKMFALNPNRWNKSTKMVLRGNYFGNNTVYVEGSQTGIFNLLELNCSLADGSEFSNNTFTAGACSNDFINIYQIDNGTDGDPVNIVIRDNTFDCGANTNPIRISCKGAPEHVKIFIEGNTYTADAETQEDHVALFFIEPYHTETESLAGVSIYLKNNVIPEGAKLFYYYAEKDVDSQLVTLNEELLPKVYVWDDETDDYAEVSVLAYLDSYTYDNELAPLLAELEVTNPDDTLGGDTGDETGGENTGDTTGDENNNETTGGENNSENNGETGGDDTGNDDDDNGGETTITDGE